jgi:predicted ArsR family transcriptional regulator
MKRVDEFFGSQATSDIVNLRGAHYVLNKGEVIATQLAKDLEIYPAVAVRVTRAFIDAGTVDFKDFVRPNKQRGRPFNLYTPNEGFGKAIGEYNDYQAHFFADDLQISAEELEARSLNVFAVARGIEQPNEVQSVTELSLETHLHPETIRHMAIRSFYLANDTNFNL